MLSTEVDVKILIQYPFSDEQHEQFCQLARENGDHQVLIAADEAVAITLADGVEVIMGHFPPAVCAAAADLRWIQSFSAGMDKFLFPEIIERDEVAVSNVAGLYAPQGGEHAWALLLALARGIDQAIRQNDQRKWAAGSTVELTGLTLGVVGMGGFGLEMVKRAAGYDMQIIAVDPVRRDPPPGVSELVDNSQENLHSLLRRSDVVMIACPKTKETYHLIGSEELALMRENAYLINVTRGGIIDEEALCQALSEGQIAGAGIDVTETEPLPADSPLWDARNIILTPHRAGASQHRPRKVFEFFLAQLERYLKGEAVLNIVNKRKGY
ncbi:MAG TPA: D-2-hydroxyacid dehydrogenase [Candidatus Handelsmanbacteria bacterium]|nr:D-2-hydroxyacid dehydrogenase [Candidatus Handelsmanbacteria bacterium]